jgi:exodeoxyribonuclease VII large subunit
MPPISLYELNNLVRQTVEHTFTCSYWLQAELSEVHERHGHCYLEFVQKDTAGKGIIAKARGQVWRSRWELLAPYFMQTTGQPLTAGMQVLVGVQATFHELYGYSLNVTDIDPTYTLGDIARRRREIIQALHDAGIADMNKQLPLPTLLQRIAVISSPTAAGYEDFSNQLHSNRRNLRFHTQLFPATMQGEAVEQSIISALNDIARQQEQWDAVVIIRGGGSTTDLAGFDSLALAENVAQFPLPIITGIGHERDDTVVDIVAHTRVKTPTAAAEFLIRHQEAELDRLYDLTERTQSAITHILQQAHTRIQTLTTLLPAITANHQQSETTRILRLSHQLETLSLHKTALQRNQLQLLTQTLQATTDAFLRQQKTTLGHYDSQLRASDPRNILRLGFSITRVGGKALRDASTLHPGDSIETTLLSGTVISRIETTLK